MNYTTQTIPLINKSEAPEEQNSKEPAEVKVFGKGFFKAYPYVTKYKSREIDMRLVFTSFVVALSVTVVFLIGVNIVIQYRTINMERTYEMIRKVFFILLSALSIIGLIQASSWIFEKINCHRKKIKYGGDFEMVSMSR
ncbi:hypothetical protein NCAS_0C03980 [Naumovozyma castellii]|uniref:Uncharacterized protein n=1 Tax=Naumovozyma castellii TaxID=27288 RepID=G0VD26_NAUCA|nr:hypothetical protein NCAS_0C03980 [Naumovozyma castellii CBS 4309]CCC69388.1 hypothetical protein NCAS_0C03980 [Naumovozyma castellii CBS 4309]